MLRKLLITLHSVGAVVSIALLISTFAAKGIITSKARQVAVDRTRVLADPFAAKLEETLGSPTIGRLIRGDVRERMEAELADYRKSPDDWLAALADGGPERAKAYDFPAIKNPLARKSVDALVKGVAHLKEHLEKSYRELIFDLRLFAGTNLVVFLVAAWLTTIARTPRGRHWLLAFSGVMLVTTVMSISAYLDQSWTWSLLTGRYMGWGYPAVLGFSIVYGILKIIPDLARCEPAEAEDSPKP